MGARVWDLLWEAGRHARPRRRRPGCVRFAAPRPGVPTLGPGHRHPEYETRSSAGLGFAIKWDKEFQGKEALERVRANEGPAKRLDGGSSFDDPRASRARQGAENYWHGDRVVELRHERQLRLLDRAGDRLRLSAVGGWNEEGTPIEVEYFGEQYNEATVAADPLFDSKGARLRGLTLGAE